MTSLIPRKTRDSKGSSAAATVAPDGAGGSAAETNPDLPAGYDDETSEFFVPPAARPGYYVDPDEEMLAFAEEMSRDRIMGWLPGPLVIARQRVTDAAYPAVREWSLEHGERPDRWPAPAETTAEERRQAIRHARVMAPTPQDHEFPTQPDIECVAIWQHWRRVGRAQAAAAKAQAQNKERLAYERSHTCEHCHEVRASVASRKVMLVPVRCCGNCEVLLNAGLISVLSREKLANGRTRGEAVAQWLQENQQRWAGLEFPETSERTIGDGVQPRGLRLPPAIQSGPLPA